MNSKLTLTLLFAMSAAHGQTSSATSNLSPVNGTSTSRWASSGGSGIVVPLTNPSLTFNSGHWYSPDGGPAPTKQVETDLVYAVNAGDALPTYLKSHSGRVTVPAPGGPWPLPDPVIRDDGLIKHGTEMHVKLAKLTETQVVLECSLYLETGAHYYAVQPDNTFWREYYTVHDGKLLFDYVIQGHVVPAQPEHLEWDSEPAKGTR